MTIGSIFASVLRSAINEQARIFDYGDRETFIDLWTMGDDGCPEAFRNGDRPGHVIIVWEDRALSAPDEGANGASDERTASASNDGAASLEPHLTPMDWALAFSIRALAQEEAPDCPDVAIHIIDLTGKDHRAWSMKMRHQLLAEMPWVTLHAPLIPQGVHRRGYRHILDGCSSLLESDGTSWKLRLEADTLKTFAHQGYGKHLKELSRQWVSTMVQTHDHHDLNNLVGPWFLSRETTDTSTSTSPSLLAFWNRLLWTGFLREEPSPPDTERIHLGNLNVLAIDDQLDVGWNHVILRLFGADADARKTASFGNFRSLGAIDGTELYGSNDARTLLESLKKPGAFQKRCFDSPIRCNDDNRPWLLVLDLLLFSGGSTDEGDWLGALLCIARGLPEGSSGLAWPGFTEGELGYVENWLKHPAIEDPAYNTALSLLPRLCALRWPSVPILLFSGTSRRALTDKLAAYRNIFLAPQKPNLLSGNAAEETEVFLGGWRRELDSAKGLIAVQRKLLQLQRKRRTTPASVDGTDSGRADIAGDAASQGGEAHQGTEERNDNQQHRHLTIAFDESGNFVGKSHSAVGGVIIEASHCSENKAKELTFDLLEELRAAGIEFYDHPPVYTEIYQEEQEPQGIHDTILAQKLRQKGVANRRLGRPGKPKRREQICVKKGKHISKLLGRVLKKEIFNDIRLGTFRFRVPMHLYAQDGSADGTYLKWLARNIELLLCEYLPSVGYDEENITLSIWLPTRVIPRATVVEAISRDQYFDINTKNLYTVGGYSVAYEIVLRALEGRHDIKTIISKCQLKLRKIPYAVTGDPNHPYDSALHWYCPVHSNFLFPHRINEPRSLAPRCHIRENKDSKKKCNQELIADYSVAQHLADACITDKECFPSDELGFCNIDPGISFDVDAGKELEEFLSAGRSFDRGQAFEGFATCFRYNWFRSALGERNKLEAPIGERVEKECRKFSGCISGDEIIRLAVSYAASHTGKRWRITLTGYRDAEAVVSTVERIFNDCNADKPQIMSGRTSRGRPSLLFEIGEAERAVVLDPLKNALQAQQAEINPNPL